MVTILKLARHKANLWLLPRKSKRNEALSKEHIPKKQQLLAQSKAGFNVGIWDYLLKSLCSKAKTLELRNNTALEVHAPFCRCFQNAKLIENSLVMNGLDSFPMVLWRESLSIYVGESRLRLSHGHYTLDSRMPEDFFSKSHTESCVLILSLPRHTKQTCNL